MIYAVLTGGITMLHGLISEQNVIITTKNSIQQKDM